MKMYFFTLAYVNPLKQTVYYLLINHELISKIMHNSQVSFLVLMNVFIVFKLFSLSKAL